jgi:hypothetical protein
VAAGLSVATFATLTGALAVNAAVAHTATTRPTSVTTPTVAVTPSSGTDSAATSVAPDDSWSATAGSSPSAATTQSHGS